MYIYIYIHVFTFLFALLYYNNQICLHLRYLSFSLIFLFPVLPIYTHIYIYNHMQYNFPAVCNCRY